jgi:hypothetical protein
VGGVREIVVYLPTGSHRATADIVRGSAIVGQPRSGSDEVTIYFEGAIYDQQNVRTLADRAKHAAGRMVEEYPTTAMRVVPRDALVVVGTFDLREGRILLTGPHSERAVADWLGSPRLNPAELRPSTEHEATIGRAAHAQVDSNFAAAPVEPGLLRSLMERGGVRPDGEEWVASDGRRTVAVGDALLWALESIAREKD